MSALEDTPRGSEYSKVEMMMEKFVEENLGSVIVLQFEMQLQVPIDLEAELVRL